MSWSENTRRECGLAAIHRRLAGAGWLASAGVLHLSGRRRYFLGVNVADAESRARRWALSRPGWGAWRRS